MAKYNEKNYKAGENKQYSLDSLLTKDEQVLLKTKPNKKAFIFSKILFMLPFALIWIVFDGFMIYMMVANGIFAHIPTFVIVFIVIFFLLHLLPFWFWLANTLTAWAQYKNVEYALTSKRIIIKSGIFVDIKNIYYAEVESVNVKVGLVDKMFKVGDIYIRTKLTSTAIMDIENPYVVMNKIQEIVNNIKTDMAYPNALRPEQNPGYETKYTPKNESEQ